MTDCGQGETVVLLHGVGLQKDAWHPQIDLLGQTHRVVALDLPGHGDSAPLPQGSQLPDFVAWLAGALDSLGLAKVNLAGHSMGAMIAGGFAVEHPDRVTRVALLNGVYDRDSAARQAVLDRAADIPRNGVDVETPQRRWFGDEPLETLAARDVGRWLRAVDQTGYATAYAAFAAGDATYSDRFSQITCPFLALTGDQDRNSTPEMSQSMAERVQDGQSVVIEGHGHMVPLTAAQTVNRALVDWLARPIGS